MCRDLARPAGMVFAARSATEWFCAPWLPIPTCLHFRRTCRCIRCVTIWVPCCDGPPMRVPSSRRAPRNRGRAHFRRRPHIKCSRRADFGNCSHRRRMTGRAIRHRPLARRWKRMGSLNAHAATRFHLACAPVRMPRQELGERRGMLLAQRKLTGWASQGCCAHPCSAP